MVWPALPAMPLIDETQHDRVRCLAHAPRARTARRRSARARVRLTAITWRHCSARIRAERLVAGDPGVVDDDVDAAVWPRAGAGDRAAGASGSVMSSGQRRAADGRGDVRRARRPRPGRRAPTTCAPSRASTRGDLGADPARGAGHQRDLAVPAAASQSTFCAARGRGPMRTTCPETYADRGESRKRSVDSIWLLGLRARRRSAGRSPLLDLLADRAHEALERALRDRRRRVEQSSRRSAEHDRPGRRSSPAGSPGEERPGRASSSLETIPVASNTSALNVLRRGRVGVEDAASSLALRSGGSHASSIAVDTSASIAASTLAAGLASRGGCDPVRAAPSSTGPAMTGPAGS